jgi:hypothetical protein
MRYGLLAFSTENLGDDIQSLAVAQYLPKVDDYLDRDYLSRYKDGYEMKVVMAGWFKHNEADWPPPPNIKPLFVGFHANQACLWDVKHLDYYKQHEPIGCRDWATLAAFQKLGIKAYFSGCVSLTLRERFAPVRRSDIIYIVDVEESGYEFRFKTTTNLISMTHKVHPCVTNVYRFAAAEDLLSRYSSAGLVITSRLHAYLPCLSFRTRVILVGPIGNRHSGLVDIDPDEYVHQIRNTIKAWAK